MISVIIPSYNSQQYIAQTLDSVLAQTYRDWECIVVDDGSTDSSAEIVKKYCERDERIRYVGQVNGGPSRARNHGLSLAGGEYVQFLDSDDVILPERFEIMLAEYDRVDSQTILYSNLETGDNNNIYNVTPFARRVSMGRDIYFKEMYAHFMKDFLFIPGCVLFPSRLLGEIKWNCAINHSEDWDFYLQILHNNDSVSFRYLPRVLFYYRNTTGSLSKDLLSVYRSSYMILEQYLSPNLLRSYIRSCSKLFYRNVLKYGYTKEVDKMIFPVRFVSGKSYGLLLLFPLICFVALYYFIRITLLKR